MRICVRIYFPSLFRVRHYLGTAYVNRRFAVLPRLKENLLTRNKLCERSLRTLSYHRIIVRMMIQRIQHSDKDSCPHLQCRSPVLVSMMGLRLPPVGRRASVMMMMVMMMTLLVGDAGVLARRVRGDVADDQLRAVALGVVAAEVLPVSRLVQGLLAAERRMAGLVASGLVQVLPGLPVIPVQAAPTLRGTAVETGDGVAVGRCTVTIVFAAPSAVPKRRT